MKLRSLLVFVIPVLFLGACQRNNQSKPVHHRTKVVKKVVYVHHKESNHKNDEKPKPVPPVANLKHHYRVLNEPVVVLTFHNKPNENIGTQMNQYLNSIVNLNQYHVQVNSTNNATYVTLREI